MLVTPAEMPSDFLLDHGFMLLKPEQFDRALESFQNWTLAGIWRGINDDYKRAYTESESNLRRDEVVVARGLLGMTRSLELISAAVAGDRDSTVMREAATALSIGDPWLLSLDLRMLLIPCGCRAHQTATSQVIRCMATTVACDI